jgi:hypothetical protein
VSLSNVRGGDTRFAEDEHQQRALQLLDLAEKNAK